MPQPAKWALICDVGKLLSWYGAGSTVERPFGMNWADYKISLLALTMWREAADQGHDGMRAVGHVIANRVAAQSDEWGKDWDHVLTKKWAFSSIDGGPSDPNLRRWPTYPDEAFEWAMLWADRIFHGLDTIDMTDGAVLYWNPAIATSDDFKKAVESGVYVKTATIGQHDFYKEVHK